MGVHVDRQFCHAELDGRCRTHDDWCISALRDAVRRARFHERENYARWQEAQATLDRLGIKEWVPEDGDQCCQNCGRPNPSWFADNAVWNEVVGDESGVLCPTCFALAAPAGLVWRLYVDRAGKADD